METVSVVVPTRNRSALLITTLTSVLWQQNVDLEVIVVDEASTDDTAQVVARLQDPRVTVIRNAAAVGPGAARNRGAALASGEWLAFVDDDDVWAPDKLRHQLDAARQNGRSWAYAGVLVIGERLEVISSSPAPDPEEVVASLPRFNAIPGGGSNVILRRDVMTRVGGFDERLAPCEDWELWMRVARCGLPASVNIPLVGYRVHPGNASIDQEKMQRAVRLMETVHHSRVDWGRMHRWLAESCLRTGRRGAALAHFARAAAQGHASGVLSDVSAIAKRKVPGPLRGMLRGSLDQAPGLADTGWLQRLETFSLGDGTHALPSERHRE